MTDWQPISTAPTTGQPIRIRGLTYLSQDVYEAVAVWTTRCCPSHACEGWFPPTDEHDGMGPYGDVTDWQSLA